MTIPNNEERVPRPHKKTLRPGLYSLTTSLPPWPVLLTRPRNSCRQKAIEWASSGYEAIPLFGRRGQIRSNGRCDVGWKGYPSWEAGLLTGGGWQALRAGGGGGNFWLSHQVGMEEKASNDRRKGTRRTSPTGKVQLYMVVSRTRHRRGNIRKYICPTLLGGAPMSGFSSPQPPAPPALVYHHAMLTLPSVDVPPEDISGSKP